MKGFPSNSCQNSLSNRLDFKYFRVTTIQESKRLSMDHQILTAIQIKKVSFQHTPVLLNEIISFMPENAESIVDFTLGGGNHAHALLKAGSGAFLYGCDRDKEALAASQDKLKEFKGRFDLLHYSFSQAVSHLVESGVEADFAMADLGVSSHQLSTADRGFSFRNDGPLDMRMNGSEGMTAADVVNTYTEQDLTVIIKKYGEERFAQRIAQRIVRQRESKSFATTSDLADCVLEAIPKKFQFNKIHAATKTFQAIRIEVNSEINELEALLANVLGLMKQGGRIALITFHSLEDRPVKQIFKQWQDPCTCPKNIPVCVCNLRSEGKVITRKAVKATQDEIEMNNRSRSARLRVFEKR